jgi:hypothetical protein
MPTENGLFLPAVGEKIEKRQPSKEAQTMHCLLFNVLS